jgi:hypothetical protein
MAELLAVQIRPDYLVHLEAHLWIHEQFDDRLETPSARRKLVGRGDVAVIHGRSGGQRTERELDRDTSTIVAPARIEIPHVDIERQRFLEIRDRRNRALITIVEVLSPANKKPGADRDQYLTKRAELLAGPVHFVEIDLLRCGIPMPDMRRPPSTYGVVVSRAQERPEADFWPIGLRDPLPVIPIPLRPEIEASVNLLELVHDVYDRGTYADEIYESEPEPPLDDPDRQWARELIAESTPIQRTQAE